MKQTIESAKIRPRLAAVWRKLLAGLAILLAVALPKSVYAAFRPDVSPSFSKRASNVRNAIEQMPPGMRPTVPPPAVMQWGNWPNWQNWGNWNNWNNWANWRNW
jgi:hypothetical protein